MTKKTVKIDKYKWLINECGYDAIRVLALSPSKLIMFYDLAKNRELALSRYFEEGPDNSPIIPTVEDLFKAVESIK